MSRQHRHEMVTGSVVAALTGASLVVVAPAAHAAPARTEVVSVTSAGRPAMGRDGSMTPDGRLVAFTAYTSLVPADRNRYGDVYLRDRRTRRPAVVSLSATGRPGNQISDQPSVSADGRYVAFRSSATNLVAGDSNRVSDVFVRDTRRRTTVRVSVGPLGRQANQRSWQPAISADGRYVAFTSSATNLIAGDTNRASDVFVHDRVTRRTERVSVTAGGQLTSATGPAAISANGRYVAFAGSRPFTAANGFSSIFVRDRARRSTAVVDVAPDAKPANRYGYVLGMSDNGRYVVFTSYADNLVPGDTSLVADVFVRDMGTRRTERVSVSSSGAQANGWPGLIDRGDVSNDGRYVTFSSHASNLVPGDTNRSSDVFVRDRRSRLTSRVSLGTGARQANRGSSDPQLDATGRLVLFSSYATNLVPRAASSGVYLRDRGA